LKITLSSLSSLLLLSQVVGTRTPFEPHASASTTNYLPPPPIQLLMYDIWIEKYRPMALDEVVGQTEITSRLKAYVRSGNLPHLLFAGPAGVGKTTCAIALAREFFGSDNWARNFQELNASDERGIGVVRGKIKEFARIAPLGEGGFKIIFLDEADSLTNDAQAALRRTMEKYTHTCRFILSCNYSSKIIDPIQSRCAVFRFHPIGAEGIRVMLQRIAAAEKLDVDDSGYDAIIYLSEGDMRGAVNMLQVAASLEKRIDEEMVFRSSARARPEDVKNLLTSALRKGDFLQCRTALDDLLIDYGLSGTDVIKQMHREVFNLDIPDLAKVNLVDKIGEIEFRMVEGANERIQLEALLAHIVLVGKVQKLD